jgi:serine/threonine protein kinase
VVSTPMRSWPRGMQVDVWSLGVLAFELLTAQLPFCGGAMRETLQKIMLNQVVYPPTISPLAREFISLCLQSNPASRPTIDHLQQHPWIRRAYEGDDVPA